MCVARTLRRPIHSSLFLLPLCTHEGRRGEKQLSGFCHLCGPEHIKTHRVLKHGLHVVYPSLSWATFCPSPTAACSICSKGRLFDWQFHKMSKPLHSVLIEIIHDLNFTDSFSNVLFLSLLVLFAALRRHFISHVVIARSFRLPRVQV